MLIIYKIIILKLNSLYLIAINLMGCTGFNVKNDDVAKESKITKEIEINKEKNNENESILNKISLTIFNDIFSFIKGYNFKFKLFKNSKIFQKKLNLTFFNYQKQYFSKFDMNVDNYIKKYNKSILRDGIFSSEDLSKHKIDQNLFESYYINYINNYAHKLDEGKIINNLNVLELDYLNLKCPFLESLSKTDIFDRFNILIYMYDIKEKDLEQIYIDNFDKLYKTNANYSKLDIAINKKEELKYIEELKINDNKIKYIHLISFVEKEDSFLEYIPFLKKFKSLKCLSLNEISFTPTTELNFPDLEELKFDYCENITLNQEICLNIKKLRIIKSSIQKTIKLLQFPKLEELVVNVENIENLKLAFDFLSLKNLKTLLAQYDLFLLLYNLPLEKISIFKTPKKQKEFLQKIIDKKTLLSISFYLNLEDEEEILSLKGENCSVQEANISCSYTIKLGGFHKKFPNILSLI